MLIFHWSVLLDRALFFVFLHSNMEIFPLQLLPLVQNVSFTKGSSLRLFGTVYWGTAVQISTYGEKLVVYTYHE